VTVQFEKAFDGHFPVGIIDFGWEEKILQSGGETEFSFDFQGKGFVLIGEATKEHSSLRDAEMKLTVYIDGDLYEEAVMPTSLNRRKPEVAWKYNLPQGSHKVRIVLKDPVKGYGLQMSRVLIYGSKPAA